MRKTWWWWWWSTIKLGSAFHCEIFEKKSFCTQQNEFVQKLKIILLFFWMTMFSYEIRYNQEFFYYFFSWWNFILFHFIFPRKKLFHISNHLVFSFDFYSILNYIIEIGKKKNLKVQSRPKRIQYSMWPFNAIDDMHKQHTHTHTAKDMTQDRLARAI